MSVETYVPGCLSGKSWFSAQFGSCAKLFLNENDEISKLNIENCGCQIIETSDIL